MLLALAFWVVVLVFGTGLAGCTTVGFYQQAVSGQMRLLAAREDVDEVLGRPDLEPELRVALLDSKAVLAYAHDALGLAADGRYSDYVALDRDYVVWNLVVTPIDSVAPRTWCFPVAGCVSYRGYFSEARAQANAAMFDPAEFDTWVGGVPAYSTLGWFDDPLLSSFIFWPPPARAELLLHELAHGELYVGGDTEFNESFATFVAQTALPGYLGDADDAALEAHRQLGRERRRFNSLLLLLRDRLSADFDALDALPVNERRLKARQLSDTRYTQASACFKQVADEFRDPRWSRYFEAEPNLARLSLVGAYHRWVGAFHTLFVQSQSDYQRFFQAAAKLAESRLKRRSHLAEWQREA